jgi:hypothetical protein
MTSFTHGLRELDATHLSPDVVEQFRQMAELDGH